MDRGARGTLTGAAEHPKQPHLAQCTSPSIQAFRVHMESSDSSDHPGEDESMRYNYVRQGNQLIEIKRYSGGRIISRFSSVLYNFGGTFIPPGQYSFPFSFKTG